MSGAASSPADLRGPPSHWLSSCVPARPDRLAPRERRAVGSARRPRANDQQRDPAEDQQHLDDVDRLLLRPALRGVGRRGSGSGEDRLPPRAPRERRRRAVVVRQCWSRCVRISAPVPTPTVVPVRSARRTLPHSGDADPLPGCPAGRRAVRRRRAGLRPRLRLDRQRALRRLGRRADRDTAGDHRADPARTGRAVGAAPDRRPDRPPGREGRAARAARPAPPSPAARNAPRPWPASSRA